MRAWILLFTFLQLAPLAAWADGVVTIKGRLTSNTAQKCAIETKTKIYYLLKKDLSAEQTAELKPGKLIALTVPFSAIDHVQKK